MDSKPKMGRPIKSGEPKTVSLHLRITKSDAAEIQACSESLGLNRTETIMLGIKRLKNELKK